MVVESGVYFMSNALHLIGVFTPLSLCMRIILNNIMGLFQNEFSNTCIIKSSQAYIMVTVVHCLPGKLRVMDS